MPRAKGNENCSVGPQNVVFSWPKTRRQRAFHRRAGGIPKPFETLTIGGLAFLPPPQRMILQSQTSRTPPCMSKPGKRKLVGSTAQIVFPPPLYTKLLCPQISGVLLQPSSVLTSSLNIIDIQTWHIRANHMIQIKPMASNIHNSKTTTNHPV